MKMEDGRFAVYGNPQKRYSSGKTCLLGSLAMILMKNIH
jgi:hypothetical protein